LDGDSDIIAGCGGGDVCGSGGDGVGGVLQAGCGQGIGDGLVDVVIGRAGGDGGACALASGSQEVVFDEIEVAKFDCIKGQGQQDGKDEGRFEDGVTASGMTDEGRRKGRTQVPLAIRVLGDVWR
jgi:hypothetical protein